jgi:hypothetical protein
LENIKLTFKWSLIDQSPQDEERAKGKGIDSGKGKSKGRFQRSGSRIFLNESADKSCRRCGPQAMDCLRSVRLVVSY